MGREGREGGVYEGSKYWGGGGGGGGEGLREQENFGQLISEEMTIATTIASRIAPKFSSLFA